MLSNSEAFKAFLEILKGEKLIDQKMIEKSLEYLGGIEEVIKDSSYLLAYEAIGKSIGHHNSTDKLVNFLCKHNEIISSDPDSMCFFLERLIDQAYIRKDNISCLIDVAPKKEQPFLIRRYGR